jgi:hypothetical protein
MLQLPKPVQLIPKPSPDQFSLNTTFATNSPHNRSTFMNSILIVTVVTNNTPGLRFTTSNNTAGLCSRCSHPISCIGSQITRPWMNRANSTNVIAPATILLYRYGLVVLVFCHCILPDFVQTGRRENAFRIDRGATGRSPCNSEGWQ